MRGIFLSMLLAVSLAGISKAQEATGKAAEEAKQEVLQVEREKAQAFLSTSSGSNHSSEWRKIHDADGCVSIGPDGDLNTKAQQIANMQSGALRVLATKQYGHDFHVYGNGKDGTTVVVTYFVDGTNELSGKRITSRTINTNVYIKMDGVWRRVSHQATYIPNK